MEEDSNKPARPSGPSEQDYQALCSSYEHLKACLEKESDLVIKWLTMLILINAGLFAAVIQIYLKFSEPRNRQSRFEYFDEIGLIICATGIVSCGFIFFAIDASSDQFEYLRQQYFTKREKYDNLGFPRPFGDENEERRTKMFPRPLYILMGKPFIIPASLFFLWIAVLIFAGWRIVSIFLLVSFVAIFALDRSGYFKYVRRAAEDGETSARKPGSSTKK